MTAEGLRLSLTCCRGDGVSESKCGGGGGGRSCRVEEFRQFLRHQALSWWWGQGFAAGTGRQI